MSMTLKLSSIFLTVGSLLFILLLLVSYFSKKRYQTLRSKLYRYMLVTVVILVVTELIFVLEAISVNNDFLTILLTRIHWSTGIFWFFLLYYYSLVFIGIVNQDSLINIIKYNFKTKAMFAITIICLIVYLFIPFELPQIPINYIPKYASYFVLGYCAFSVALISFNLIKHNKNANVRTKFSVWLMIAELFIIFGLQLNFPYIAFLPLGATLQMYFLYFNIENPDLEAIAELEKVKDNIERSNRAKSDFLSNMSHEIRSPMNAIVGFSSALLNTEQFDVKNAKIEINHIKSASNNLLDIVNNILDISKIESGVEELEEKEYSLGNIIMELTSIINARLADKKVKFIIDIDKNIPSKLYGDATKVFQILLNILTNAVKYTEVGRITLHVAGEEVGNTEKLHFRVSDTGYGIKKEDYNKLFEKFSRLDAATQNEIEGTGLGLVITKRYVDLMNGKIWFDSEYEVGTNFYVDIDQKIINKEAIGNIEEPINNDNKIDKIDCSKYKVLIVDDNKLNLKVASRLLSEYNFQIETLDNAKDCIYKVKAENHYDMIFLDHMMPEMDGVQALHILRKLDGYKLPPIVALTANAITGMKQMYLNEGFDEYLSKPINISELNKLIIKYFGKGDTNDEENS